VRPVARDLQPVVERVVTQCFASGSNRADDFGYRATLWHQRGEVEAGANLLAHLHEDETEPVVAIAGATWTDTVLLFASRKRLTLADAPEVVVATVAVDKLGVLGVKQLFAQNRPGEL
jgi:hypothetical protein